MVAKVDRGISSWEQHTPIEPIAEPKIIQVVKEKGRPFETMVQHFYRGFSVVEKGPQVKPFSNSKSVFREMDGSIGVIGEDVYAVALGTEDIKPDEEQALNVYCHVNRVTVTGQGVGKVNVQEEGQIDTLRLNGLAKVSTPSGELKDKIARIEYSEEGRQSTINEIPVTADILHALFIGPDEAEEDDDEFSEESGVPTGVGITFLRTKDLQRSGGGGSASEKLRGTTVRHPSLIRLEGLERLEDAEAIGTYVERASVEELASLAAVLGIEDPYLLEATGDSDVRGEEPVDHNSSIGYNSLSMAAETTEDRSVFAGWARDGVSPLVEAKSAGTGAREEQSGAPRTIRADVAIAELEAKFRAMHPQMEPLYPRDRGESLGQWWKSGFGEAFRRRPNDIQGTPDRLLWLKTAGNVVSTAAKDIVKIVIPGRGK